MVQGLGSFKICGNGRYHKTFLLRGQRTAAGTSGTPQAALRWAHAAGADRTELGVYEFNETARRF